jgi:hypothetical protein
MSNNNGTTEGGMTDDQDKPSRRVKGNGKLPWRGFFPSDWLSDTGVRKCSPATKGIWIDRLCLMWQNGATGESIGTIEQLRREQGCSDCEMEAAIRELIETRTADVFRITNDNKTLLLLTNADNELITKSILVLRNRRMHREYCNSFEISEKRSKAGRKGMEKRWNSDNKPIANADNKPITRPYQASISASTSVSGSVSEQDTSSRGTRSRAQASNNHPNWNPDPEKPLEL